jgi:effector-binding domain-containing protein
MRLLKAIFVFLFVLVVALVGVAFVLPGSAHVERSITIARPASEVFAVLNGYRRFNDWSPWATKDPSAVYTYGGPAAGVGAKMSWHGDPKTVGSGSQEIVASKPEESVTTALDFGDMGRATAQFLLARAGGGTKVTWTLDTKAPLGLDARIVSNLIGRYMGLFMDRMVGPDYAAGLARLKALVETFPDVDIGGVDGKVVQLAARKIYFVTGTSGPGAEAAGAVLGVAYAKLEKYLGENGIEAQGPPLTITTSYDKDGWKFEAGLPVGRNDAATRDDIQAGTTYAGLAAQFLHTGPHDRIGDALNKASAWIAVQGYRENGRLMEEYLNDRAATPPGQLQTRLTIPVE